MPKIAANHLTRNEKNHICQLNIHIENSEDCRRCTPLQLEITDNNVFLDTIETCVNAVKNGLYDLILIKLTRRFMLKNSCRF